MPAFTLTLAAAVFFEKFRKSEGMQAVMEWVKPVCIAMIFVVILTLSMENYTMDGRLQPFSIGIGLLMLYLLMKRKWSVPKVIALAAALGVVCYGVLPLL